MSHSGRRPNKSARRAFDAQLQAEVARARTRGAAARPQAGSSERPILAQPQPVATPGGLVQSTPPARLQGPVLQGSSYQGSNHSPVDYYRPAPPSGGGAMSGTPGAPIGPQAFAPGDPIRPAAGIDDGWGGPRQWSYPTGVNISTTPRQTEGAAFQQLRNLSELYEGIQLCEALIFRIFDRLDLQIVPHQDYLRADEPETDSKWLAPARAMRDWLMTPHRTYDLHAWCKAVMRELLELDACGIYYETTRGGGLYGLRLITGDTLVRLADTTGAPPIAPYPAYLQVINGAPAWLGTTEEVEYLAINSRAGSLYGRPPVEQILYRVNMALRKEHWDLTHWTDGSTPEGLLETDNPALLNASADDMDEFERLFNAMLAGNDALRVRTKTVPPGWHWKPTKQSEVSTALDQYLLNLTASAFGLSMDELGFTATSNRSTGSTQEDMVYRNAVRPYTDYVARFLNRVIRRFDGTPIAPNAATVSRPGAATRDAAGRWDARFVVRWGGIEEPYDWNQRAYALSGLASKGIISPTQVKHLLHIPILPGEQQVPAFLLAPAGANSVVFPGDLAGHRDQINEAHLAGLAAQTQGAQQQTTSAAQQQQLQDLQIQQGQVQLQASKQQLAQQAETHDAQMEQHATQQQATQQQATQQQAAQQQAAQQQLTQQAPQAKQQPPSAGAKASSQPRPSAPAQSQQGAQRGLGDRDRARGPALPPLGVVGGAGGGAVRRPDRDGLGDAPPAPAGPVGRAGGTSEPAIRASASGSPSGTGSSFPGGSEPGASTSEHASGSASGERAGSGVSDEWRAWRERSLRAVKRGERVPAFVPRLIPPAEHAWVAARLAEADGPDAVRAIFEDARAQTYKVRAQTYKVVVGLGSEDQMDAVSEVAAPSPAPSPDDPLDALARALTERLAAMQQQELRALKAEVSAALSL